MKKSLTVLLFLNCLSLSNYAFANNKIALQNAEKMMQKSSWAFEENKGQVTGVDANNVKFVYKDGSLSMFLMQAGIAYQFHKVTYPEGYKALDKFSSIEELEKMEKLLGQIKTETYRMDVILEGANPNPKIKTEGKSEDFIQYYNHNALDVRSYQKVMYCEVYPNIDWVVYINKNAGINEPKVKYDFIVHPGGDPSQIKLKTAWVEELTSNADGSITLNNRMGSITEQRPISFQEDKAVQTNFVVKNKIINFLLSNYDINKDIVIDPGVVWATYYGGTTTDIGNSCTVDGSGNVYLAGQTTSSNNIASGGHQNTIGGNHYDAFLVKFNSAGVRQWATYYGGSFGGIGNSCAVDGSGNVYLAGQTNSSNNIASGGHQNTLGGGGDAFLVKFNSAGVRQWATYYGGSFGDFGRSCAVDGSGNVYLAGQTNSTINIASGGHQNIIGGGNDAFLVKFNSAGVRQWGTYYGEITNDDGRSCALDGSGNVYLAGQTTSSNSIASGGHQNTLGGGGNDAFLVKFNSAGVRQWATYYGGSFGENGDCCAVDGSGNVYLAGQTNSSNNIASGGHQNTIGGGWEAFLVKFNSAGVRQWATYYGGSFGDLGNSCAVDGSGNVYLAGVTTSTNNIASGGHQNTFGGSNDAFLVKFNNAGVRQWATYYGGTITDIGNSCTVDGSGNVYLAGYTASINNIASGGHQNTFGGNNDAFLVKFNNSLNLITQDTIKACSDSVLVSATSGLTSYSWSNGKTTASFFAKSTGWYKVTATNSAGNAVTDSIFVSIVKANILNNDTTICLGRSVKLSADTISLNYTTGITCLEIQENNSGILQGPLGSIISNINFASYGTPTGSCNSYNISSCNAANSFSIVSNLCIGNNLCNLSATNSVFGDPCSGIYKRLYVSATYQIKSDKYLWSTGDTTPTINVTPSVTTKYWVRVSNGSHFCTDTVTVTVNQPPTNLISQDTIKACGDSVLVSATSGMNTYSWSNGKTTASFFAKSTGWYKVTATNSAGCSGTDSVFVSIVKANILNNDTAICIGQSLNLITSHKKNNVLRDQLIDQFNMTFMSSYSKTVNTIIGKKYRMEITGTWDSHCDVPNGKLDAAYARSINSPIWNNPIVLSFVHWNNNPVRPTPDSFNINHSYNYINLVSSQSFQQFNFSDNPYSDNCGNLLYKIYLIDTFDNSSFLWSTGDTTPTINVTPTVTTKYWVRVSNGSHFCTDTVTVTVSQPPANLISQDTIKACGDSVLVSATSGLTSYSWSNGKTTASFFAKSTGWYKVTATNSAGCSGTDSVFVSIVKANILNNDTAICLGRSVRLRADSILGSTPLSSCAPLPTNLQNGLVGYWPFCGNANDVSGNGNHGTVNGATLTTDRFGNLNNAYSFNGNNSRIEVNDANSLDIQSGQSLSISTWIKHDLTSSNIDKYIISKYSGSLSTGPQYAIGSGSTGKAYSTTQTAAGPQNWIELRGNNTINDGNWHHFVYIWRNGTDASIYVDNVLDITSTHNLSGSIINALNLQFGCGANLSQYYKGFIDDIAIWNRALSPQEIQQVYTSSYPQNYLWSTGDTTPTINVTPSVTTKYWVRVSNGSHFCTDTVTVTVNQPPTNLISQDTIKACGDSVLVSATSGMNTYSWSNGKTTASFFAKSTGWYKVTATNGSACSGTDSVFVSILKANILNNDTAICVGQSVKLKAIPENLVAYWPFNGNANDMSGNEIHGTVYGASLTTDRFGIANNAYSFDGIDDYIVAGQIPFSGTPTASFSWGLWVCPSSTNGNIVSMSNVNPQGGWNMPPLAVSGQKFRGRIWINNYLNSSSVIPLNSWYYVVLVFDHNAGTQKLYINGVLQDSQIGVTYSSSGTDNYIFLGQQNPGIDNTGMFSGKISNFHIFGNKALTLDEIQQLYNSSYLPKYLWSTGDTTPTINVTPSVTTKYWVRVSNGSHFCTDTVTVTVNPKTFSTINQTICEGQNFLGRTISGTYIDTLLGANSKGCDSIRTLNLSVNPKTLSTINQTICEGQSFLSRTTSGTFIDTLVGANSKGCDSIRTLNLTVNPKTFSTITQTICEGQSFLGRTISGTYIDTLLGANSKGCDSIRTLNLTVNLKTFSTITQTICEGQSFLSRTTSGTFIDTLVGANSKGCDSIRTLNLTVNPKTFSTINQTICQGQSFLGRTTSGMYTDTLVGANSKGCDSIRTLNLTVNPKTLSTINQTICEGQSFLGRTISGTYIDTLVGANSKGCDSIRTLNLTVNPKTFSTITQTICEGQSFLGRTISGTYIDTLLGANSKGCDSIRTLNLTVNLKTFSTITQTICEGQNFLGRTISGTYIDTLLGANSKGCDSIRTLNLTVNPKTFSTITQTICEGQSFLGRTTSGTYTDTLVGANSKGCDSIRTLNLTVNPKTFSTINQTICEGQSFLGRTISGTYIDTLVGANSKGCDSIRTLNLTVNPKTFSTITQTICEGQSFLGRTISGTYIDTLLGANSKGCDSIRTLNLTVNLKTFSTITQTICEGQSFLSRTTSGTFIDTLVGANSKGCDSIRTLNLTVNPKTFSTINQTICQGQSFLGRTTSGTYTDTLVGANSKGCDSIRTLNLTVNPKTFSTINQTICQGQSFLGRTISGIFIDTLVGANSKGCDSIRTLNLTVNLKTFSTINKSICEGQSFLGRTTSGTYIDTLLGANSKGCDSIRTLNLTVNLKTFSTINQTICQGQSFLGRTISGMYIDTLIGANSKGCDSIRTLNLIVNSKTFFTITQTICEGQSFLGRTTSGTFIDTLVGANSKGCDSIRTLNLTVKPNSIEIFKNIICYGDTLMGRFKTGIYYDTFKGMAVNGCDSILILDLLVYDEDFSQLPNSIIECKSVKIIDLNKLFPNHIWYKDSFSLIKFEDLEIIEDSKRIYGIEYFDKCKSPIKKLDVIINKGEILIDKPEYCEDDTIVLNFNGNYKNLKWFNNDTSVATRSIAKIPMDIYVDFEYKEKKCRIDTNIKLKPKPNPPVVSEPITLDYQSTIEDINVIGENITWYSDKSKNKNIDIETIVIHQNPYYVSQTVDGCESDLLTIKVLIDISKIMESIHVNNSMSPNGDGILDAFTIDNIEKTHNRSVQIINRWGELVFESKNYKNNWYGVYLKEDFKGEILPDGVYYYSLEFDLIDYPERFKRSGYIYLKK